ncbi:DNA methyltransferase [Deinococcus oregonensis]|uniref:site-specific DNA-methyltransferase (cytosine-N(4)-specific) n=1 Tax=Deinococcus oregonensis TaxID=1805970 RepID=A0ABV6AYF5_9DEIO
MNVSDKLFDINWDFTKRFPGLSRSPHWYPGTFPSEVPAALIEILTVKGDLVVDPYGGIGTTVFEAVRLGRDAVSVDVNPAAHRISSIMLHVLKWRSQVVLITAKMQDVITDDQAFLTSGQLGDPVELLENSFIQPSLKSIIGSINTEDPNWESLSKWYHPDTLNAIKDFYLKKVRHSEDSDFTRVVRFLILSASLKALSSQDKSWGHIADNVYPKELVKKDLMPMLKMFAKKLDSLIDAIIFDSTSQSRKMYSIEHNWLDGGIVLDRKVNAIITSPPYAGAIDYHLSQKLTLYLMGRSEDAIKGLSMVEIGARRRRNRLNSEEIWAEQLKSCFTIFANLVEVDGFIAAIMPHKDSGRSSGTSSIQDALLSQNFFEIFKIDRSISQTQARQSWTSIKRETVMVFQKHGN